MSKQHIYNLNPNSLAQKLLENTTSLFLIQEKQSLCISLRTQNPPTLSDASSFLGLWLGFDW